MLRHFVNEEAKMKPFTMIGFQTSKRKLRSRKHAYGRQHVFSAFFLNLRKVEDIDYNKIAWAMEDVGFNLSINDKWKQCHEDGVIVKCQRFIASKKRLDGGIVPYNIPTEIQEYMAVNKEWSSKPLNLAKRHRSTFTSVKQDLITSSIQTSKVPSKSYINLKNTNFAEQIPAYQLGLCYANQDI